MITSRQAKKILTAIYIGNILKAAQAKIIYKSELLENCFENWRSKPLQAKGN